MVGVEEFVCRQNKLLRVYSKALLCQEYPGCLLSVRLSLSLSLPLSFCLVSWLAVSVFAQLPAGPGPFGQQLQLGVWRL